MSPAKTLRSNPPPPPPPPPHPPTYLMYGPLEHGPKIDKSASVFLKLYFHLCLKC